MLTVQRGFQFYIFYIALMVIHVSAMRVYKMMEIHRVLYWTATIMKKLFTYVCKINRSEILWSLCCSVCVSLVCVVPRFSAPELQTCCPRTRTNTLSRVCLPPAPHWSGRGQSQAWCHLYSAPHTKLGNLAEWIPNWSGSGGWSS